MPPPCATRLPRLFIAGADKGEYFLAMIARHLNGNMRCRAETIEPKTRSAACCFECPPPDQASAQQWRGLLITEPRRNGKCVTRIGVGLLLGGRVRV